MSVRWSEVQMIEKSRELEIKELNEILISVKTLCWRGLSLHNRIVNLLDLGKGMNSLIPTPSLVLNSNTVLLQIWLWHWITHEGWYAIKQGNQTDILFFKIYLNTKKIFIIQKLMLLYFLKVLNLYLNIYKYTKLMKSKWKKVSLFILFRLDSSSQNNLDEVLLTFNDMS